MLNGKKIRITLLFIFILTVAGIFTKRYLIAPEIQLKDIEIQNLQGDGIKTLHQYSGKVIVLNFWATWCPPCVQEMPMFSNLYSSLDHQNVEFIFVTDDDPQKVQSFLSKTNLDLPVFHLTKKMKEYGVYTIPATFIFDKKGNLIQKKLGVFESADELYLMIKPFL